MVMMEQKFLNTEPQEIELTNEKIFQGNPEYNNNKNTWRIYQNLMKIDFFKSISDDFNFMNYVYFPTPKFYDIKNIKDFDIINICKSLTLDFIKIINPQIIIVLGTSTGIDPIAKNTKTILQGYKKRLIVKGEIDGTTAYGIPHPSYNNFHEENQAISNMLKKIFSDEDIEPYSLSKNSEVKNRNISNRSKFDIEKFKRKFGNLRINETKKWLDIIYDGINNDEILIRVNPHNGEFGVRKNGNSNFKDLKEAHFYNQIFDETYDRSHSSWFIRKEFKNYTDINSELLNDLENFISKLDKQKNRN